MNNGHQYDNATQNDSPWQYGPSGYSSTSSQGTVSSGSSPNSQYYGRSPDRLGYGTEDVASNYYGHRLSSIGSYSSAIGCDQCTNQLCNSCVERSESIQRKINQSQEQLLEPVAMRPAPEDIPSPPPIFHHLSNFSTSPLYCDVHQDAERFYCQTCCKPYCEECGVHRHVGHAAIHLMDAVDGAALQASQVLSEARVGVTALREDLDVVQVSAESLDQKARDASTEVLVCMRRIAAALENREKDLLDRIEKARLMKMASLKARDDGLRAGINRLSVAVDRLTEAMESSTLSCNPLDLLLAKDMTSAEVFQTRQARRHLPPVEENWISFTGIDNNFLNALANLGNIVITNPGPIGDRRTRGRHSMSPQFFRGNVSPTHSNHNNVTLMGLHPVPRGRAIPGITFPVIVLTGRTGQTHTSLIQSIKVIGNENDARDTLCRPWGVACDKEGHIIVADRSNNRIMIYGLEGNLIRKFGSHGTGPVQFDRPAGVAVDARKRIVVADKDNHRIQILTMEGGFIMTFGEKGCRCGQFNYPWDVATNSESQIVVSDTRNHRVQLFSPEGIFLRKYGNETSPNMWKHFDSPRGVAFNPEGNVVVTDFNNHRVLVIDSDFMHSRILGSEPVGSKQFLRPQGLIVDDEGNIIVADSRNHRIQIFDSAGCLKWTFGTHGKGIDEMDRPSGIALTPDGRLVVVDFGNNRVMVI